MAVGPARLVRDLGRCRGAYRWLGRVPSDASLFQVYVVPPAPAGGSMPPAVEAGDRLRGRHIVPILGSGMHESGWTWALSPYAGDIEGVRSLTDVLKMRAGHQMPVYEGAGGGEPVDRRGDGHASVRRGLCGYHGAGCAD